MHTIIDEPFPAIMVTTQADRFLWSVAERLQHPGLTLYAHFQAFCLDTFDLFSADEAAAEWQRRNAG